MRGLVNMRLVTSFLLLAWCPWSVLGDIAVAVQTNGGQLKPGQVLNYVVSANPVPSGTLGMVLIGVSAPGETGGRVFWPWSLTMTGSPKQGAITIPSGVPPKFYTVDVHANTSVYSPLLASSNAFEIISATPPTTQVQVTTNVVQTTKQTTIITTQQQTVVQQPVPNSPQSQPDPTPQNPNTNQPPTTPNTAANAPSSNTQTNTKSVAATGQSGSAGSAGASQTPSQTTTGPTTDPAPTPTADTSVDLPPTTSPKKKSSAVGPAIGGAIGGIIIILLLLFLWRRYYKKKQDRVAIDEMAESNARFRVADGAAAPVTSPFANTFREFQPNRGNTAVSPFLLDSERSPQSTSPDPTMSSKYREAYGGGAGHSGQMHHHNTSFGASTGYLESASGTGGTSEQLRTERERVLGEISALRARGGQGGSAYAQSSVSAGSSGAPAADEEMRNRLDMLTQHVARLENALEQAVNVNVFDAPPTYHQAPSQAASQRG